MFIKMLQGLANANGMEKYILGLSLGMHWSGNTCNAAKVYGKSLDI